MVGPVDAAGAERLAGAGLIGVVASGCADLADLCADASVGFDFHVKSGFEQHVEAADAFAFEGDAVGLGAAVGELDYQPGTTLGRLVQGRGVASCGCQECKEGG